MKQMRLVQQLVRRSMPLAVGMAALGVAALAATPALARAQAFGLNEVGTCAIARGGATTGAPCLDPSVIYWNPGAATRLPGISIYAGLAAIGVNGSFTRDLSGIEDEGDAPVEFPPHLFVNWQYRPDLAFGLGVYVPYGLTSQWKSDFPGRFLAQKASLQTIYIQPNVAYSFAEGRVSVGGGPVIGYSTVELRQGIDFSQQELPAGSPVPPGTTFASFGIPPETEFAQAQLKGSTTAFGFNLGVHAQVTETVQLGARYLSEVRFDYEDADATFAPVNTGLILAANNPVFLQPDGTPVPGGTPLDAVLAGQFAAGGSLVPQGVNTKINHPAQLQVGVGYTGLRNTLLSLDYAWVNWSTFKELPVEFTGPAAGSNRTLIEDYGDSWAIRGSGEYTFANAWRGRLGASYAKTPVPDVTVTPLLPDMDRYNFTAGVGIPLAGRYVLDLGYWRVETKGRRGRVVERETREQTASQLNGGWYALDANVFALSLKAQF